MSKMKEHLMKLGEQIDTTDLILLERDKMEKRPWGYFVILEDKDTHKVKRIVVHGGQRLSYQSHEKRNETWIFTEGEGIVTIDNNDHHVMAQSTIKVPVRVKHRVKNTGESDLVFIEVQTGEYFGEDDIIRYSDDYGRTK
jgi:mannose-6-phosphate isomerase-like protein (cupin superfamily)